jgi:hypothetical protein
VFGDVLAGHKLSLMALSCHAAYRGSRMFGMASTHFKIIVEGTKWRLVSISDVWVLQQYTEQRYGQTLVRPDPLARERVSFC